MSDKTGKESQYMISRPELGSDPLIGSDRELGRDILAQSGEFFLILSDSHAK